MPPPRILALSAVPPSPWKNGGGVTRELWREPAEGPPRLRISVADVVVDGPFSHFPGIRRVITLLDGAGFRLRGPTVHADQLPGAEPFAFPGYVPVGCTLVAGPIRDVNVMWAEGGQGWTVTRHPGGVLAGESFVVALAAGTATAGGRSEPLAAGDLVVIAAAARATVHAGEAGLLVVAPA
jgi:environmental stress-induced protein Ves